MNDTTYAYNPVLQPFILGVSAVTGHNVIPADPTVIDPAEDF